MPGETQTSTLDLDTLDALEKAATPGPWTDPVLDILGEGDQVYVVFAGKTPGGATVPTDADAALITALRNAAPALLRRAQAASEAGDRAQTIADELGSPIPTAGLDDLLTVIEHRAHGWRFKALNGESALAAATERADEADAECGAAREDRAVAEATVERLRGLLKRALPLLPEAIFVSAGLEADVAALLTEIRKEVNRG